MVQAPSDNFWVVLSKAHFNSLVSESGKDIHKPLLLTEITGYKTCTLVFLAPFAYIVFSDGKIFCGLLRYSDQFSPQFLAKLEVTVFHILLMVRWSRRFCFRIG